MMHPSNHVVLLLVGLLAVTGSLFADMPDTYRMVFKLYVEEDGIYRVTFDQLGYAGQSVASESLAIAAGSKQIPIWIQDGGDGEFGAGDAVVFRGMHLSGHSGHYNEYARYNVYWLTAQGRDHARMQQASLQSSKLSTPLNPVRVRRLLERNLLRVSVGGNEENAQESGREPMQAESWYWRRLSHLDSKPFDLDIPINDHRSTIRVGMTGLSRDRNAAEVGLPHHRADLYLNGQLLTSGEWNGQKSMVLEADGLDPSITLNPVDRLEIRIPRRQPKSTSSPLIDLSLLNWIEVIQPHNGRLDRGQVALVVDEPGQELHTLSAVGGHLFSPSGRRTELTSGARATMRLDETGIWYQVAKGGFLSPTWITHDKPSNLASADNKADYLIITHASLVDAAQGLAALRRNWGYTVSVIDVEDIYDEFGGGVPTAMAIRDFIGHTQTHWTTPVPRLVLFAGDAAWNIFSDEIDDDAFAQRALSTETLPRRPRNAPSLHAEQIAQRNLVPTLQVQAHDDFAASDNGLVVFDDDDWRPSVAAGRLPVVNATELTAIIDKLSSYNEQSDVGPWRREISWVSDNTKNFRSASVRLAALRQEAGLIGSTIFPIESDGREQANARAPLVAAFNTGQVLIHFLGHGGRFVWRTGPPDYRHGSDLFSVRDIAGLTPNGRLPMVLSMTCSSGPFDHPEAESIAEAMLMMPQRGAIAVLAASWRVPASFDFSNRVTAALTEQGTTIGEAIMRAKQNETNRWLVESYNLLGDPAMELAAPQIRLALKVRHDDNAIVVGSPVDLGVFRGGETVTDWLDSDGRRLKTERGNYAGGPFEVRYELGEGEQPPVSALVYIWHSQQGIDALGTIGIDPAPD